MTQDIHSLLEENEKLRKKLEIAETWMKREVQGSIERVSKNHVLEESSKETNIFLEDNIEEMLIEQVGSFFSDTLLIQTPEGTIDHIVTSEINYYFMTKGRRIDPLSIIIGYHKVFDSFIEKFLIRDFRKFAKKKGQTELQNNDPLEKSLHSVVNSGYILGVGRFFHLLSSIAKENSLLPYQKCFLEYLNKYPIAKNTLLEKQFLIQLEQLVRTEVFGRKRHTGSISEKDIKKIRLLLVGDFKKSECILKKLLDTQKIDI